MFINHPTPTIYKRCTNWTSEFHPVFLHLLHLFRNSFLGFTSHFRFLGGGGWSMFNSCIRCSSPMSTIYIYIYIYPLLDSDKENSGSFKGSHGCCLFAIISSLFTNICSYITNICWFLFYWEHKQMVWRTKR